MKKINFTEFRKSASHYIDLVERGETLQLLRHGKAVAKIAPSDGDSALPFWKRPGPRLKISGPSLSEAILEERRKSP